MFLLVGLALLWALRGWRTWGEVAAFVGLAYVLGLATVSVTATLVLVFGSGLSGAVIVMLVFVLAASGIAAALFLRRALPGRRPRFRRPSSEEFVALAPIAATAAALVELYRAARIDPLTEWDAWSFWIPKAKAIYFFNGLDPQLFRSLPGPSYPILLPALDAMGFRFMGSADTTTLTVQAWLLLVGFLLAAAALLRGLAPRALVWLFLLLVVLLPEVPSQLLTRLADVPLDLFFVLAALAIVRTLVTHERWPLAVYGVMLAATLATKREGQLLAACLVVGALVAAGLRRRESAYIVAGAVAAYLLNVPWRIWWTSRHLTPDTPAGGVIAGTLRFGRMPASFELVVEQVFGRSLYLSIAALTLAAAAVALTRRDRTVAVLYTVTLLLGIVGFAWVNWSDPLLPITTDPAVNPTGRAVASLVLLGVAMTPALLAGPLGERRGAEAALPDQRSRTSLSLAAGWSAERLREP